jgi:hypothetical protein
MNGMRGGKRGVKGGMARRRRHKNWQNLIFAAKFRFQLPEIRKSSWRTAND